MPICQERICSENPGLSRIFSTNPLSDAKVHKIPGCFMSYLQYWTKLLRKLHTQGAFFLNFVADRFFPPPPPPPGSSVVGSSKESRIPKHLQEATLNWGRGFSLRKAVDLEIVLLRQVVRINENIFSSSFVQDCSLIMQWVIFLIVLYRCWIINYSMSILKLELTSSLVNPRSSYLFTSLFV